MTWKSEDEDEVVCCSIGLEECGGAACCTGGWLGKTLLTMLVVLALSPVAESLSF
jgi:hypothetical protein